eukprot:6258201-Pyramimonas_sp.AAC.3
MAGGSAPPAARPSNRAHPRGASGNIRGFGDFANDDNESDDDSEYFAGGAKRCGNTNQPGYIMCIP